MEWTGGSELVYTEGNPRLRYSKDETKGERKKVLNSFQNEIAWKKDLARDMVRNELSEALRNRMYVLFCLCFFLKCSDVIKCFTKKKTKAKTQLSFCEVVDNSFLIQSLTRSLSHAFLFWNELSKFAPPWNVLPERSYLH